MFHLPQFLSYPSSRAIAFIAGETEIGRLFCSPFLLPAFLELPGLERLLLGCGAGCHAGGRGACGTQSSSDTAGLTPCLAQVTVPSHALYGPPCLRFVSPAFPVFCLFLFFLFCFVFNHLHGSVALWLPSILFCLPFSFLSKSKSKHPVGAGRLCFQPLPAPRSL